MKTSLIILSCWAVLAQVNAGEPESLDPASEVKPDTPSLETAFKNAMFIERTTHPPGIIHYTVRIYDPKVVSDGGFMFNDVVLVVGDSNGRTIVVAKLPFSDICTTPPNKAEFRTFDFWVHKDFDRYTLVNIGRYTGQITLYTPYRLPEKSTPHPTAEPAGADQPATKPADKPAVKVQPSTPTPKIVPR